MRVLPLVQGKPKKLAYLGDANDFAQWNLVAHSVYLVVGKPQLAAFCIEVQAYQVANAPRSHLPLAAVKCIHANNAANATLSYSLTLSRGCTLCGWPKATYSMPTLHVHKPWL